MTDLTRPLLPFSSDAPCAPWLSLALAAVALVAGCGGARRTATAALDGPNTAVIDWNVATHDAFMAADKYANPLQAVRVMAMVHLAQHDALAALRPSYASYAFSERASDADPVAAAASAAFEILVAELPGQRTLLAERLAHSLAASNPATREAGRALGQRAAAAVLQARRGDGSDTGVIAKMSPAERAPGAYRPTPPYDFVFAPGWRDLRPFALQSGKQFRVAPPPALDSARYTADFDEVKRTGGKDSAARTQEETTYARFWYEFSDIGWNRIARVVATDKKLGLQASARLFALVNMAMSDGYVAGWDSKLHYDFWRPATAILAADNDGNPATAAEPTWQPEQVTPPIQDYPSTHSVLGDAAAEVLAHVFGDATSFAFTSTSASEVGARRYRSFKVAADENADSRVKAGLHFRSATVAGQALGRQIGAWVVSTALRPLAQ